MGDAVKVIDDWRSVGWLAGLIALINLLINVLRYPVINSWLSSLEVKWVKPLCAVLLGGALGGCSTLATGASVPNSIVAGVLAGLGSVGFHEFIDQLKPKTG
jgi:hypothetical protein